MLKIIETHHNGPVCQWHAHDEADFCAKVLAANPRADLDPNADFATIRDWLASDLQSLEIVDFTDEFIDALNDARKEIE